MKEIQMMNYIFTSVVYSAFAWVWHRRSKDAREAWRCARHINGKTRKIVRELRGIYRDWWIEQSLVYHEVTPVSKYLDLSSNEFRTAANAMHYQAKGINPYEQLEVR